MKSGGRPQCLAISGGCFIVSDKQTLVLEGGSDRNDPVISGGYFTANPGDYVAENKTAVAETNVIAASPILTP
jgi:hypothetical protein